jgi:hypothetical protein
MRLGRQIAAIAIAGVFALALSACGSDSNKSTNADTQPSGATGASGAKNKK